MKIVFIEKIHSHVNEREILVEITGNNGKTFTSRNFIVLNEFENIFDRLWESMRKEIRELHKKDGNV